MPLRRWFIFLSTLVAVSACEPGPQMPAPPNGVPRAVYPAPMPADGFGRKWMSRHDELLKRIENADPNIVFIGDSLTQSWERDGRTVWDERFVPLGALNLGVDGDRTETLIWRLKQGAVAGLSPELIVLLIGTNNTGHRMDDAQETYRGVKAAVRELKARLPKTEILVLSLLPRGSPKDAERLRNDEVNALLAETLKSDRVHFLDIQAAFLQTNGELIAGAFGDGLHLTERGYRLFAAALQPALDRALAD